MCQDSILHVYEHSSIEGSTGLTPKFLLVSSIASHSVETISLMHGNIHKKLPPIGYEH